MVRACLPSAPDEVIARVQRAADGIPFLVEESLAAPGVPRSFADGVRSRLAAFSNDERLVLHAAALLGRQFDWRLLPAATGLDTGLVADALEHGTGAQLLAVDADTFRFRHMLTREAVAAELLPPRRAALAARTLAALEAAHPGCPGKPVTWPRTWPSRPATGTGPAACCSRLAGPRSTGARSPPPSVRCAAPRSCSVTVSSAPRPTCSWSRAWRWPAG